MSSDLQQNIKDRNDYGSVRVSDSANARGDALIQDEHAYQYPDSRKLGVTGAAFLIINKIIGTGIFSTPSSIFQATGSVGVSIFLWLIGEAYILCC